MTQIRSLPPQEKPAQPHRSVEELAREQGVGPIQDLNEISDLWPLDDDPDVMLRFILQDRAERRAIAEGKAISR